MKKFGWYVFLFSFIFILNLLAFQTKSRFLNLVQRKAFYFFWNEANPKNGLIRERAANFMEGDTDPRSLASIASVGFGLTAICIGHSRGWISYDKAYQRILTTLKFFKNSVEGTNGFYYHFLNIYTGKRAGDCELSSIDTAIFLAGALFAGAYFKGTQIERIADQLYRKTDWDWMRNKKVYICMGWKPEEGFLPYYWQDYSEGFLLYVLAIGSPTHPPKNGVEGWKRFNMPVGSYKKYKYVYCPWRNALFIHQYPQLWLDLRDKIYNSINFFENSVKATLANRQYCIDNSSKFKSYNKNCWGLTACDGPDGYTVYGAPPWDERYPAALDGTVAPTAAGGSVMFTPNESIRALKYMYKNFKEDIWGKYGFCDAFNIDEDYYDGDVIGIDLGAMLLSIENYRTGLVWKKFMQISYIKNALKKMGFKDKNK